MLDPTTIKSRHFTLNELTRSETAQRLGIDNTPPEPAVFAMRHLMSCLDELYENYRATLPDDEAERFYIRVNSGYRCPELNAAVGSKEVSNHVKGEAADITLGSQAKNRAFFQWFVSRPKEIRNLQFDEFIDEHGYQWIHVAFRIQGTRNRSKILHIK